MQEQQEIKQQLVKIAEESTMLSLGVWGTINKHPKTALTVAIGGAALLGTLGYFAYRGGWNIKAGNFELNQKNTGQRLEGGKAKNDINAHQQSSTPTNQHIGSLESSEGGINASQKM